MEDKLKNYILGLLPDIDEHLSESKIRLAERPLSAGGIIVRNFILEVSGDANKDDYATKPWFAILYHHVHNWYRDRYGPLLEQNPTGFARGVVLVRGFPIELKVPLTRGQVETPNETAWLYFPVDVDASEDPLAWLIDPPPLAKLDDSDLTDVRRNASQVARSLRSVRQYTIGPDPSSDTIDGLLDGVLTELEGAASNILRNEQQCVGPALWDIQMACERALKAFCQQKAGQFKETHDLFVLFDDAVPHGLTADRNLLKALPRVNDAVDSRYGLGGSRSIADTVEAYKSALRFVSDVCKSISRKITFAGAGFLLKKAPWITLPDKDAFGRPMTEATPENS